jgi:hypothetical protein
MMRNGRIYAQATWVLRTEGKGSGLWPTPTQQDGENDAGPSQYKRHTPAVRDYRTGMPGRIEKGHTYNLPEIIADENGMAGQLNPTWVEWLMGYPLGWTDLNASGIALSLKSRKSYSGE